MRFACFQGLTRIICTCPTCLTLSAFVCLCLPLSDSKCARYPIHVMFDMVGVADSRFQAEDRGRGKGRKEKERIERKEDERAVNNRTKGRAGGGGTF